MAARNYIDFKLYLTAAPGGTGACQVALLPTPEVGETITPVVVPADKAPAPELQEQLAAKSSTDRQLTTLGKQLTDCLLPDGTIRERFKYAYDRAGTEGGVRLRLILADHALKQWPWEFAYFNLLGGPDELGGFLALNPRISLVRHEPLPFPHPSVPPAADASHLRMLIVAASPIDQPPLKVDEEVGHIEEALKDFNVEGVNITTQTLRDATPSNLLHQLTTAGPTSIFHFAGHGISKSNMDWFAGGALKQEGYLLLLEDLATKRSIPLPADDLAKSLVQAGVRLAVLGACSTGLRDATYPWADVAGAFIEHEIPAVIAMQYEVIDTHADAFSRTFYGALASGLSLDEAMSIGRLAMLGVTTSAPGQSLNLEWGVPVLYSRLPNGVLFPERMAKSTASADQFRTVTNQTITRIAETGKVVGVAIDSIQDGKLGISVNQHVDVVEGELTGAKVNLSGKTPDVDVKQNLGTVSGDVTGVKF